MNRLFLFLALVLLRIGSYAQYTLPSSYKPRSEFRDNESFLRYNFEEYKEDYLGKEMGLLYMAYGNGIRFGNLSTSETTPWMEEDNRPYIEGVLISDRPLSDILCGKEYISLHIDILSGKKRFPDDEFWHEMPDTLIFEAFLERTRRWMIRDIKVMKFQLPSVPK